MKVNRAILEDWFINNPVFKTIDPELKTNLLQAIDSHTYNLALVLETKLGLDFLRYLSRMQALAIEPYVDDLLNYVKLIATLNKRKEVYQSDLYLLRKVNLPVEDWPKKVRNSIGKTMFGEFYIYLDQNSNFKDELTVAFYDKNIDEHQMELAQEIIKWLEESIEILQKSEEHPTSYPQLKNRFYQQEIYVFYHEQLERILQIMNFQLRAFKLIETY